MTGERGHVMATTVLHLRRRRDGYWGTYWRLKDGRRFRRTFGRDKALAYNEFSRFAAAWQRDPRVRDPELPPAISIRAAWEKFQAWAAAYYRRPDGTPTNEAENFQHAVRELLRLYGDAAAETFTPGQLRLVREAMIDADLCRTTINARIRRIRQFFGWMVCEGHVAEPVRTALNTLLPLEEGRELIRQTPGAAVARESEPVTPVPEPYVWAVCDRLPPTLAALVRLLYWCGCRPDEACAMRANQIDMSRPVWRYYPNQHKTVRSRREKVVALGPHAQEAIRPLLDTAKADAYVFSPLAALRERRTLCTAHRHQPVRTPATDRRIGERYTVNTLRQAIERSCDDAGVPRWSPGQLRHNAATRVAELYDIDMAAAVLGHARVETTQRYARVNIQKAVQVMGEVG